MTDATPVYRAIILECERRRVALGMSMEKFSEFAGLPDRYYAKALRVDEPSGRQASWSTLQIIVDCLFPDGFDVQLKPKVGAQLDALSLMFKTRYEQSLGNGKTRREHMAEIGRKGAAARASKLSVADRVRIARNAGLSSGKARRTKRAKLKAAKTCGEASGSKPLPALPRAPRASRRRRDPPSNAPTGETFRQAAQPPTVSPSRQPA
jgi:hypothetical protein